MPAEHEIEERFARVYGSPGEAPRVAGLLRAIRPLLLICFILGYLLRAALPYPRISLSGVGILLLLVAGAAAYLLIRSGRRLSCFLKGAEGEEEVARRLAFLDSDYAVFHGLRLDRRGNFDHVVVGPAGVFVIETKNWKGRAAFRDGRIFINGREPSRSPLRQVKEAVAALVDYFDREGVGEIPVRPVVCFFSTELPEEVSNINGVLVCRAERLPQLLGETLEGPVDPALRRAAEAALKKALES